MINILTKIEQYFLHCSEEGDNLLGYYILCFLIISPSMIKVLPLNWPRCKDHFTLITCKNISTQLGTFFLQGLHFLTFNGTYKVSLHYCLNDLIKFLSRPSVQTLYSIYLGPEVSRL